MVTVIFAGKNVGDMDLDFGGRDSEEGVTQGDRSVAVAAKVDNETISREARLLDMINKFPLNVALIVANFHVGELFLETVDDFLHGGCAVDLGFATASEVKVGSVNNFNVFHVTINGKIIVLLYMLPSFHHGTRCGQGRCTHGENKKAARMGGLHLQF